MKRKILGASERQLTRLSTLADQPMLAAQPLGSQPESSGAFWGWPLITSWGDQSVSQVTLSFFAPTQLF